MVGEEISPQTVAPAPDGAVAAPPSPAPVETSVATPNAPPVSAEVSTPAPATPEAAPVAGPAKTEEAPAAESEKPVENAEAEKPAADAAPAEGAAEAAKAESAIPVYAEFKLPEGFAPEPAQMSAYTNVLGKYNIPQEAGQELVDLHIAQMQKYAKDTSQQQQDTFTDTRKQWVKDFQKQAGNRADTVLNDAKWAIGELVKNKTERAELWNVLAFTGAGDNRHVINAFASVARKLREREAPAPGTPAAAKLSPAERRYGANGANRT